MRLFRDKTRDIHINWQNDFDYTGYFDEQRYYGVFKDAVMVGGLSIHPAGRISYLYVAPEFRNMGVGRGILHQAVRELNLKRLAISFPNNASLAGFVRRLGFLKESIAQYEMYLPI